MTSLASSLNRFIVEATEDGLKQELSVSDLIGRTTSSSVGSGTTHQSDAAVSTGHFLRLSSFRKTEGMRLGL